MVLNVGRNARLLRTPEQSPMGRFPEDVSLHRFQAPIFPTPESRLRGSAREAVSPPETVGCLQIVRSERPRRCNHPAETPRDFADGIQSPLEP